MLSLQISELDVADTQTPALADTRTADRQRAETACRIAVFILQTEMQYVQQLTNLVKVKERSYVTTLVLTKRYG